MKLSPTSFGVEWNHKQGPNSLYVIHKNHNYKNLRIQWRCDIQIKLLKKTRAENPFYEN